MKPETAQQVRAKLGFGADVPDDQLDDKAAQKALSLSADLATLTTERDTLKTQVTTVTGERDAAKADVTAKTAEVLALSGDNREPDALSLSLIGKAFRTERAQVISSGVISQAGMDELDKLFYANGKPNKMALSLSAGSTDPFYSRVLEIIKKFPGIKTGNGIPRGVVPAEPNPNLELSGDKKDEPDLVVVNAARALHHLPPLAKTTA